MFTCHGFFLSKNLKNKKIKMYKNTFQLWCIFISQKITILLL